MRLGVLAWFLWGLVFGESAKILGVFPLISRSHYVLGSAAMRKLAADGHEVTVIAVYLDKKKLPSMTEVILDGLIEEFVKSGFNILDMEEFAPLENSLAVYDLGTFSVNFTLNHPKVKKLLASGAKYDLIFMEAFATDALIGLGHHFKAPVVGLGTFGTATWLDNNMGNPSPGSIVPHYWSYFTEKMTFCERAHNLLYWIGEHFLLHYFYYPKQKEIYDLSLPDPKPDFYHTIKHGMSLLFVNTHFSIAYPRPYVPNIIEIGGIQINRKPKPLPENLQNYLDSATNGAVYFSMGSIVQATMLPIEMREAILKTFAKFPKIKFLWKWEDTELPGKPDNLLIQNWFPQDDVLAHPNIRFFITHGGLLGLTETIYHGVPVLGIPVFGDQNLNVVRAEARGYGLRIKYKNVTEQSLTWGINEMLRNSKYRQVAQEMSRRYRDQPMTPAQTLSYWVEYVIRHNGAEFLKSAAQELNFVQYFMIDVIAFYFVVILVILWALKRVLRCLKNVVCGSPKRKME